MAATTRRTRLTAAATATAVTLALLAGLAPVQTADAAQVRSAFQSRISARATASKVNAPTGNSLGRAASATARTSTAIRQPAPTASVRTVATRRVSTSPTASTTTPAAAAPANEAAIAKSILAGYIARYPALAGTSVSFGDAKGHQAICYYKSGRIVISSTHTRSLERIIGHEVWHVIDWRDNGVIDWGENVPPR